MLFAKPNDDASININAECILRNLQNIIAPSIAAHHIENGNHGDRLKIDQPSHADPQLLHCLSNCSLAGRFIALPAAGDTLPNRQICTL